MNKREFIAGLGGAASWPALVRAQHLSQTKIWRVGYLSVSSTTNFSVAIFNAFKAKLQELGYVEGRNVQFDVRRAEFDYAKLPTLAAELVSLIPDVIVGLSAPAATALQHATATIPIVMVAISDQSAPA